MTTKERWTKEIAEKLVGRRIESVRYMTDKETEALDWHCAAVVLELDDGKLLWPSADDEGNGAGALFTTYPDLETIPVI